MIVEKSKQQQKAVTAPPVHISFSLRSIVNSYASVYQLSRTNFFRGGQWLELLRHPSGAVMVLLV